jgi:hypothetical protein
MMLRSVGSSSFNRFSWRRDSLTTWLSSRFASLTVSLRLPVNCLDAAVAAAHLDGPRADPSDPIADSERAAHLRDKLVTLPSAPTRALRSGFNVPFQIAFGRCLTLAAVPTGRLWLSLLIASIRSASRTRL